MKRTLKTLLATAAIASAALGLAACASGGPTSVVGVWGEPDVPGLPSLEFAADGSFSGSDGCNRLFGSYTVDGSTVDLGAVGSTMMFCEGVDTWLVNGATARIDGDTLIVSDAEDTEIGTLTRVAD